MNPSTPKLTLSPCMRERKRERKRESAISKHNFENKTIYRTVYVQVSKKGTFRKPWAYRLPAYIQCSKFWWHHSLFSYSLPLNWWVFSLNIAENHVYLWYGYCSKLFGKLRKESEFRQWCCRNSNKSMRKKR